MPTPTNNITKIILIASSNAPSLATWPEFEKCIRNESNDKLTIERVGCCDGPGCMNLSVEVTSNDEAEIERFANALTMALMPSKWCFTTSEPLVGYHLSK